MPRAGYRIRESASHLAEFGVVFLMFSIGLEFSLPRLYSHAAHGVRPGHGAGAWSPLLLVGAVAVLSAGVSWQAGAGAGRCAGDVLHRDSVSKLLAERAELDAPHGREVIGVLLFQDLAVVPLLILIPALSQPVEALAGDAGLWPCQGRACCWRCCCSSGSALMRPWFHLVARQKSSELFMLNVLLITLGLASLTELAGLSLALGAFVAGMLISETEYRYQVEEDIKPFRDVLLGLFFVTIGMMPRLCGRFWREPWGAGDPAGAAAFKLAVVGAVHVCWAVRPGTALRSRSVVVRRRRIRFRDAAPARRRGLLPPTRCSRCWRPWCCRCCRAADP